MANTSQASKHVKAIDKSIKELYKFQDKTKSPNPISHQYIGAIIDSTITLLSSAANALDDGNRHIEFDDFRNWESLMAIIHRSFFSMIHIAIEIGINHLCDELNIKPKSSVAEKFLKKLNVIDKESNELTSVKKHFIKMKPYFQDRVEALLKQSKLTGKQKTCWRRYFKGITTLRNKASHSDVSLSRNDIASLTEGGFSDTISEQQKLQLNTRQYSKICKDILQFFDEILDREPS